MRILPLPEEDRLVLKGHDGRADAPVFIYRPLTVEEKNEFAFRLMNAPEGSLESAPSTHYLRLFRERVVRVENLLIGDEPYDHERHHGHIDYAWQVEIGRRIWERTSLSETEQGKSSSPSD